jgi:hypothetical protein
MVNCLGRPNPGAVLRRELRAEPSFPPWRGCNRLTAISNADAKSEIAATGSQNTPISKGFPPMEFIFQNLAGRFLCVLLPTSKNFSQCLVVANRA